MTAKAKTRDQVVLEILSSLGEGSAADIIRAYEGIQAGSMNAEEIQRFSAGVHGSCSILHDAAKIRRIRIDINPTSGKEVFVYAVETIQRAPRAKVDKGYKEKCEELAIQLKRETDRADWLGTRVTRLNGEIADLKAQLVAK